MCPLKATSVEALHDLLGRKREGKKERERNCTATLLGIRNYADDAQVRLSDWQGCGADILAGVVVKLGSGRVHF